MASTMRLADYLMQNPLYAVGGQVGASGTATTPVHSPMEGLARALQGGLGGLMQGYAVENAKGEQRSDQQALAQAMELYANDPAGARKILASRPNLSDTAATLLASDVGHQRQIDLLKAKDQLDQQSQQRDMGMFFPGGQGGGTQTAGGPTPPLATGSLPAGAFANNTGNIRAAPGVSFPGQGSPQNGFMTFDSPQSGVNAHFSNLQAYAKQNPGMTVAQAIAKWAPPNENDTQTYIRQVAEATGINPGMPLVEVLKDPAVGAQLLDAMTRKEKGGLPQGVSADTFMAATGGQPQGVQPPADTTGGSYGQKEVIAQGSTPQVSPGAPQQGAPQPQGQTALNVPNGETIQFQGLDLPRAAVASAMMIRDAKERQGKLTDIVRDAVKKAGGPDAGTAAGDVHILDHALKDGSFASDPRYVAAFNRASEPKMSQGGQLQYPDMSAYPRPILPQGQPTNSGQPRFEDTPASRFQMSGKLADDFNQIKQVKDYREVVPIFQSMQDAATRNNRVADLNLVYGLAKIMDPTSVVREGEQIMVRNAQGLPDWVKGMISAANGGSQFPPEQRARILQEAESRVGAYKQQHDSIAQQFEERAQRYGLNPRDVLTTPGGGQQQQQAPQGDRPVYDTSGKRIK